MVGGEICYSHVTFDLFKLRALYYASSSDIYLGTWLQPLLEVMMLSMIEIFNLIEKVREFSLPLLLVMDLQFPAFGTAAFD